MTGVLARLRMTWLVLLLGASGCGDSPTAPSDSADDADAAITTPVVVTFTGVVGPNGTASRSFTAQIAGTATASLGSISPATALGVAFGIPRADGAGCLLGRSAIASDGISARVVAGVDPGTYCLQVYTSEPTGNAVTFTVTLEHP
jgi:hypothetical protein